MKTISVINLKGGVAKTISSVNIAHILSSVHGKRTLLIDNDKQGNTSKMFGIYSNDIKTIANIITERNLNIEEAIVKTQYENLDIIPSNMNLLKANLEVIMDQSRPQQTRLRKALNSIHDKYDYCIIDNAPDINISTINALVVSDDVIVPIKVDKFAFDGLEQLTEQIEDAREFNPNIKFAECFLTMYQRNNVNVQGDDWLKNETSYPIFNTFIRKTTKIDETTFTGKPILEYAPKCSAAKDYIALVNEYLSRDK